VRPDEDFFEEDEPVEDVVRAFESGRVQATDRANERLSLVVELLDEDGPAVTLAGPGGVQTPIRSLPLPVGRYRWRAEIAGDVQVESFSVVEHGRH
jgi:hypothetical protein